MCETSEPLRNAVPAAEAEVRRSEIAWRLHEAFDFRAEAEIAKRLGVSRNTVEEFLNGRELPTTEFLLLVHADTHASLHWILTGEGLRFPANVRLPKEAADEWVSLGLA